MVVKVFIFLSLFVSNVCLVFDLFCSRITSSSFPLL